MSLCQKCGAQMPEGTLYCTECGEKLAGEKAGPTPPEQAANKDGAQISVDTSSRRKKEPEDKKGPYGSFRFALSLLLLLVPGLNLYLIFRWAFAWGVNINKRNFARGALLALLIAAVLHGVLLIVFPQLLTWLGALRIKCITFLYGVA